MNAETILDSLLKAFPGLHPQSEEPMNRMQLQNQLGILLGSYDLIDDYAPGTIDRGRVYLPQGHFSDTHAKIVVQSFQGTIRERDLDFAGGVAFHSPDGFAWGYGGSGPTELSRAILFDVFGEELAPATVARYTSDVIARLECSSTSWSIHESDIRAYVERYTVLKAAPGEGLTR